MAERDVAKLREALIVAQTAINDWLHLYAGEFCDEERVKEAQERVGEGGTLWYIASVNQIIAEAISQAEEERA